MNATPTAHIVGKSLELTLDLVHDIYRRQQLALIYHQGTRAIPTAGGWKAIESRPDYAGLLYVTKFRPAIHVEFDAKHCASRRYIHPKKREHQLRKLWDVHEAGGIAGLLVVNLAEEMAWWLPPQPEWAFGEFTSTVLGEQERTLPVGCHPQFSEFVPDWLSVVIKQVGTYVRYS